MTTTEKHEFPMARTCPFAPPPAYEEIREEEPVSRVRLPDGGWAGYVTRGDVVVDVADADQAVVRRILQSVTETV